MTPAEAKAEVFFTAFTSLQHIEQETFLKKLLKSNFFRAQTFLMLPSNLIQPALSKRYEGTWRNPTLDRHYRPRETFSFLRRH